MPEEKKINPKDSIFKRVGGSLANAVENILFAHKEVEETEETAPAETEESAPVQQPARQTSTGSVNEELVQRILESAEELGSTLTTFNGYLKNLESIVPDEATRYKAAFATYSKATGNSVQKLLAAADEQIESLKNEKADFLTGIKEKAEEANQLKQATVSIDKEIKNLENRIAELQAELEKKSKQSRKLGTAIQDATVRFDNALLAVDAILKEKKKKLQAHLKGM